MKQQLENISNGFAQYFAEAGYAAQPPVAITSGVDSSVTLIGSGISVLKPYLLTRPLEGPGVFIRQRAIRTHALKTICEQEEGRFASFFEAFCVLVPYACLGQLMENAMLFFNQVLEVPQSSVLFRISSGDRDLLEGAASLHMEPQIETDSREPAYYRHKYGLEEQKIRGRNLNFSFVHAGAADLDVGNVIVIERDGVPFAAEFALGCQTTAMGLYGIPYSIQANAVADILPLDTTPRRKLADALVVTAVMENEKIHACRQRYPVYLYRKYARALEHWRSALDIPEQQIQEWKKDYLLLDYTK